MTYIQERGSTHVYHVNRMSKEEMDHMISLCVHEQPAYCVAACPFKADTKEMLFYAAKGNCVICSLSSPWVTARNSSPPALPTNCSAGMEARRQMANLRI